MAVRSAAPMLIRRAKKLVHYLLRFPQNIFLSLFIIVALIAYFLTRSDDPSPSGPCTVIWTPTLENHGANFTSTDDTNIIRPLYCDMAFRGDKAEIRYAYQFKWCSPSTQISNEGYLDLTKDCDSFKHRFGYLEYKISKEETDFPIAFSILMHENVEQAERLLRMIYRPQNFYCIHVDLKASEDIQNAVRAISNCFDNVLIPEKQIGVRWAEFTVLEAELACMETLWKASGAWKYFINLTGRDFPLKTNWELVQILKTYNGANDIDGTPHRRPIVWTLYSWRTEYWRTNTLKSEAPHNFLVHKGSTHIAAVRGFVGYALYNRSAIDLREWMRDIRVPDEHYFNTLSHHAHYGIPGAYKGDPDLKTFYTRHKIWMDDKGEHKCSGRWVRFVCQLGVGDLQQITGRTEMFVNKFHQEMEPLALDCAEQWYRNWTKQPSILDMEFYRNLPFVNNHV